MELTSGQEKSVEFIVKSIKNKEKVIAFIAPGGSGKTFSLKRIQNDPRLNNYELNFTATTNKAAFVMKEEGIEEAKTLHSAISKHIPTKAYAEVAMLYLQKQESKIELRISDVAKEFLSNIRVKEEDFYKYKNEKELISENGISAFDPLVFSHYVTGEYEGGVLFVDESSMLPSKGQYDNDGNLKSIGLNNAQKVFDTIVLVGDDSQLPPINGKSSFEGIPATRLTENLRAEKGLVRFLDYVREGGNPANFEPIDGESVKVLPSLNEQYFDREALIKNKVVHIVYRNNTRKEVTKLTRKELPSQPIEGEPIVYKGANINEPEDSISKNETGFFNGVLGEWANHKQMVNGRSFDEYGDGFTYLQYGYAITAHTSQGSSFDYVVVHVCDIPHFIDKETRRKWIYTATSRARKGIVIVY